MGNFISNMSKANTTGGMTVRLQLKKQHQQTTLENADYSLYFVSRPEMNTRGQYFVYPVTMPNHLLTARECAVRNQFTTAARALFKKQNKGVAERLIPVE